LCGEDQSWCRHRYANGEAVPINLWHKWPVDLAAGSRDAGEDKPTDIVRYKFQDAMQQLARRSC
jgi:hypothetical protein